MLYYILIALIVITSTAALAILIIPSYKLFDPIYGYNGKGGFDYQNCQIDGSCWVKPSNSTEVVPHIPPRKGYKLPMARMGWNSIWIQNDMKEVGMPPVFFREKFGIHKSPNYPIGG